MTPAEWQKVKIIIEEALSLAPVKRNVYLAEVCGDDRDLRREVDSLLDFENENLDLIEEGVFSAVLNCESEAAAKNLIGSQIGNYQIISELGAGGMGTVLLAKRADGAFEQQVALKIIKQGMDSDAILRRFFMERQILASLKHPNIAHLIDGGTTDKGLPYFVIEYVEGETITDYAVQANLALDERLKLFREVCAAVSFAHSNLVIHRDLKPSNILVNRDGRVKLLDFGIAKLLKSETNNGDAATATQNFVFTPEYASPEQVRGEKLTTATDVYSLGVILYELLTGSRPYKTGSQNIGEIIKAVCETEPERPSSVVRSQWSVIGNKTSENKGQRTNDKAQLQNPKSKIQNPKSLRGDLDNIILKALRKEPERRYQSVEQFSEDIKRHLEGLPVTASKDTWSYRAAKFVSRNRVGVIAAGLIVLTLLGGLAATAYQAEAARRERANAEQNFADVRHLANSFLFDFHDSIKNLPGATPARELVVRNALEYLNKLAASPNAAQDTGLQRELATAYRRVGEIQGNSYYPNLGDTAGAMQSYQKALEIRQRLYDADPSNRELQHELAMAYEGVGDMFYTDNDLTNGLANYDKSLALRLPLVQAEPSRDYLYSLAELHTRRGHIRGSEGYANLGDTLGALDEHEKALALAEKLIAIEPGDEMQMFLAGDLQYLAMQQNAVGKSAEALTNGRRSVAIQEALVARDPNNARLKESLLVSLTILRYPLTDENLMEEAAKIVKYVLAETEKSAAADPQNASAQSDLSISYNDVGRVLRESGKARESISYHERALQIIEKLIAETTTGEYETNAAQTRRFLAQAQLAAGDYAAALANFERGVETSEKALAESPEIARTKDDLAINYTGMGMALARMKQNVRANELFARAVPFAEEAARDSPHNARLQTRLADTYFESGKTLKQFARTANDEQAIKKSCELLQKSFEVWDGLRLKGILSKFNQPRLDEVSRELIACR